MTSHQPEDVLRQWRESAPYWEKHTRTIKVMFAPLTRALIEAAAIGEGESVLDVAGGTGEPSIAIAGVVGPKGKVVCTDAVAEMLAAAEREAARLKLPNMEFRQCLADDLPFADDSFDAAICRLGAMFFSDTTASLAQMLRVVKPGARLAFAVWGDRQSNPFFYTVTEVMSRFVETPPEDPDAPGAFRFAEPGKLARLLKQAGADEVGEQILDFKIEAPLSIAEFWPVRSEMSDSLREKLARLSAEQLAQVGAEVKQAAQRFFVEDKMSFPAQALIVAGRKPRR